MKIRTRFAPSPTGMMHVGNLRSAIFEYLVAKGNEGDFILRIEDTDQERKVEGAVDLIYQTLAKCGVIIDEGPNEGGKFGPYVQSERLLIYQSYAHQLVDEGKAYFCFCTEEELNNQRSAAELRKEAFLYDRRCSLLSKEEVAAKINNKDSYVIRQKMPKSGTSVYEDLVYGKISIENRFLEDQILLKSDGYPTYNFANVIDDHLMEITHVVRGNEYLSSTPKYNLLYEAFGWDKPIYIHLPMVVDENGKKLSKRHGASSFADLIDQGYIAEAIVNYLALLGFSPETNEEIFDLEHLIKIFNPKRVNKSPAVYDVKKLQWVNSHYLKKMPFEDYVLLTKPFLEKAYDLTDKTEEWILELLKIYQNHISHAKEIVEVTRLFFNNDFELDEEKEAILNEQTTDLVLSTFKDEVSLIDSWTIENISSALNNTKEKTNVKGKLLFMPIRIKVSYQMHGPELPNTIWLLGKETILERLGD